MGRFAPEQEHHVLAVCRNVPKQGKRRLANLKRLLRRKQWKVIDKDKLFNFLRHEGVMANSETQRVGSNENWKGSTKSKKVRT